MGILFKGNWILEKEVQEKRNQKLLPPMEKFQQRVTKNGSSGFPPEKGRYHLYVSFACPFAHRVLLIRKLRKLEGVISLSVVDPVMEEECWVFSQNEGCIPDSVNGAKNLREIYRLAKPDFTGRAAVPVLFDKKKGTIVSNDSQEIVRMMDVDFLSLGNPEENFYPEKEQKGIDSMIRKITGSINEGVYQAGLSGSQETREKALSALFSALDEMEKILPQQKFLCGEFLTEPDFFLFSTLYRFDTVYSPLFKCNLRNIKLGFPGLSDFGNRMLQIKGVEETCNMKHNIKNYYTSFPELNPSGVIPQGPEIEGQNPFK